VKSKSSEAPKDIIHRQDIYGIAVPRGAGEGKGAIGKKWKNGGGRKEKNPTTQ